MVTVLEQTRPLRVRVLLPATRLLPCIVSGVDILSRHPVGEAVSVDGQSFIGSDPGTYVNTDPFPSKIA